MAKPSTVVRLVAVLATFLAPCLSAQLLPVQHLTTGDGLPQSQVTALARDGRGYLWVGTLGGLARYNGDTFAVFGVREGLPANRIRALMTDSWGRLWVGTGAGLAVIDGAGPRTLDLPGTRGTWCGALLQWTDGRVLVGTEHGLRIVSADGHGELPPPEDLPRTLVTALARWGDGVLVAYLDRIVHLHADGATEVLPPPPDGWSTLRQVAVLDGEIWAGGGTDGLWRFAAGSWSEVRYRNHRIRDVWNLETDASGTMAVASNGGGLYLFGEAVAPDAALHMGRGNGLPSDVVNCSLRDPEGNLWVGTDIGGLVRLGGTAFTTLGVHRGLPDDCVFGLRRTPSGIWAGTLAGAVLLDPGERPAVRRVIGPGDGLSHPLVWTVAATRDGTVWFLTNLGVDALPAGAARVRPVRDSAIPGNAFDLLDTPDGRLWVGGRSGGAGLAVRDPDGGWRAIGQDTAGNAVPFVRCLAPRRAGGVWASLGDSIAWSDGGLLHVLPKPPPLPGRSWITVLHEDSRGRLWAGNDTGLAVREPDGSWQPVELTATSSPHVFALAEDPRGAIWVGTSQGVVRMAPGGEQRLFTPEDGLAAWETNEHGLLAEAGGRVWIGTIGGLSRYDPTLDRPLREAPPLVVERAELPGRSVDFPERLDLDWRDRHVTVHVAVLAYRDHSRCGYRARLEGVDPGWLPVRRPDRELRYTNLPPGTTRLHLQPLSAAGIPGPEVVLPISVQAPLWMRRWFQGTLLLLLVLVGVAVHQWRMAWLKKRARELEEEVAARTRELAGLAEQLEHLANHDPLTGLPNRRMVRSALEDVLHLHEGFRRRCGVLLLDVDRFKEVNDVFGHVEGDRVLREVARQLREFIRPGDVAGRFGGDEFLVVLPGADREAVEAVARRVSGISVTAGEGERTLQVTVSIGAVAVPGGPGTATPERVLLRADDLLYRVKKGGRGSWECGELEQEDRDGAESPPDRL